MLFYHTSKKYDFKFQVCTPDCDQFSENLNAHYFTFAMTNKFGAKLIRIEYIDCFSVLASKIDSLGYLRLFNLDINKEFKSNEKNELKKLFLEINDCIVKKVKKYYDLDNDIDEDDDVYKKRIECYNCFCDINYDYFIFCDGKCYWCSVCSETQYINIDGSTTEGHHPDCKNETIK
jgi:hypothetical protein